ncbi:hypothetical protein [Nocardiopsis oceani]
MSGYHGTFGASGASTAVCPEPLRRALLLAGLLTGILFTVWLVSAAPAHAGEVSVSEPSLPGGTAVTEGAETLGDSIGGAVSTVGEQAVRTVVDDASEAARSVEAEAAEPVQQVRDTVRETPLPHTEHLPEELAPVAEPDAEPAADEESTSTEVRGDQEEPVEDEGSEVGERPAPEILTETQDQATTASSEIDQGERGGDEGVDVDTPESENVPTPVASGNASATGSTATAPAVAGFLPATGAPAPAPGLFEAARHVLRSAPADDADEPIFSPD